MERSPDQKLAEGVEHEHERVIPMIEKILGDQRILAESVGSHRLALRIKAPVLHSVPVSSATGLGEYTRHRTVAVFGDRWLG